MSLLLTMLPLYLFGNLHCIGMCGPLVMMIGQHRYRYFYFFGRLTSFTLAGMIAGEAGAVLDLILKEYHIPAAASFLFGTVILAVGICSILGLQYPGHHWLAKRLAPFNHTLSTLMLKDQPLPSFLFGFFTVALPCGQTLVVFSACALSGSLWVGMLNGFAFALITSPSLLLAMNAHTLMRRAREHYDTIMGVCSLVIGTLALCRGLAEAGVIPHWVLNPSSPMQYHIVMF